MSKPSLPQGTRDFGPDVVRKRNYILNTIRNVFELYGFEPLETPAMENIETLTGKYGEEGDKLIFRVLDSGTPFTVDFFMELFRGMGKYLIDNPELELELKNNLNKLDPGVLTTLARGLLKSDELRNLYLPKLKKEISDKALKYDLTIPFARYVAMNHNKLSFPFKRYQIQPVWRADRPQRGRYREFYQCDADVVGSNSALCEVELIQIIATVFKQLGINFEIHFNNRKVLAGISELVGAKDRLTDITIALDKIEKIGQSKAMKELEEKGIEKEKISKLDAMITSLKTKKQGPEMVAELRNVLNETQLGNDGIDEVEKILLLLGHIYNNEPAIDMTFDISLARGLNYYTGSIIEIKAKGVAMGSIGGGGRYDDLTGLFGVPNIPGVGISFGVDRIYDVMEELNLFPTDIHVGTQVLFFNLGEAESKAAFHLMQQLRQKGIRSELYHESSKFDKQFKYAEKKNIPFIIIIGDKELKEKTCTIKNLATGLQETIDVNSLLSYHF